ncbi:MAG TPA: hypothetical protein VK929_12440 [Longimicrobiales bacterium]|nr:hypothetical protein [Longimicrobiales bacterium]
MQASGGLSAVPHLLGVSAAFAFAGGTLLDVIIIVSGRGVPPSSWALASYAVLAVGIVLGCAGVFVHVLQRRRDAPDSRRNRWISALALAGIGLILSALMLRGHYHIPPDPPLIGAQILATLGYAGALRLRQRVSHQGVARPPQARSSRHP